MQIKTQQIKMQKGHLTKRDAMKALLAISAVGALSACKAGDQTDAKTDSSASLAGSEFFTPEEFAFLTAAAQTIIPKTDTPGAVEAGVPNVISELVMEWGDDGFKDYWRAGLNALSARLNEGSDGDFTALTPAQRHERLAAFDADVYSGRQDNKFYGDMKTTLVTAYYMSEAGATEELIYDPVPGDWIGKVPFSEIGKVWAT